MKYHPLTETEMEALRQKVAPGRVQFKVVEAIEKPSKATGNMMIALKLHAFDAQHTQGLVFDWLTTTEKMQWKLKHFMECVGLEAQYHEGELTAQDCLNRTGYVKVKYQQTEQYGEQLKVVDYVAEQQSGSGEVAYVSKAVGFGEDIGI